MAFRVWCCFWLSSPHRFSYPSCSTTLVNRCSSSIDRLKAKQSYWHDIHRVLLHSMRVTSCVALLGTPFYAKLVSLFIVFGRISYPLVLVILKSPPQEGSEVRLVILQLVIIIIEELWVLIWVVTIIPHPRDHSLLAHWRSMAWMNNKITTIILPIPPWSRMGRWIYD